MEELEDDIVSQARGILNNLTLDNFNDSVEKFTRLTSTLEEEDTRIAAIAAEIFDKGIHPFLEQDPAEYASLYAKFWVFIVCKSSQRADVLFRKHLLDQYQMEFQKIGSDEDEIKLAETEMKYALGYKRETLEKELVDKKTGIQGRCLGMARFIGELYKFNMVSSKLMMDCIEMLLCIDEEKLQYLCELLTAIGPRLKEQVGELKAEWFTQIFAQMEQLIEDEELSFGIRSALKDVIALGLNNWNAPVSTKLDDERGKRSKPLKPEPGENAKLEESAGGKAKGEPENPPSEFSADLNEMEDDKQLYSRASNGSLNQEDLNSPEKLAECLEKVSLEDKVGEVKEQVPPAAATASPPVLSTHDSLDTFTPSEIEEPLAPPIVNGVDAEPSKVEQNLLQEKVMDDGGQDHTLEEISMNEKDSPDDMDMELEEGELLEEEESAGENVEGEGEASGASEKNFYQYSEEELVEKKLNKALIESLPSDLIKSKQTSPQNQNYGGRGGQRMKRTKGTNKGGRGKRDDWMWLVPLPDEIMNDDLHKVEKAWLELEDDRDMDDDYEIESLIRRIIDEPTPHNFDKLFKFILPLEDNEDRIDTMLRVVFDMAVDYPYSFSTAYAKILVEICNQSQETSKIFRKKILDTCQEEFQWNSSVEDEINQAELELEKAKGSTKEVLKFQLERKKDLMRRRSLGNVRFIGELYRLGMLTPKIMMECVGMLLCMDEEKLECLCKLLNTVGPKLEEQIRDLEAMIAQKKRKGGNVKFEPEPRWFDKTFDKLKELSRNETLSLRIRSILKDFYELRLNLEPWRDTNAPKNKVKQDAPRQNKGGKPIIFTFPMHNLPPQLQRRGDVKNPSDGSVVQHQQTPGKDKDQNALELGLNNWNAPTPYSFFPLEEDSGKIIQKLFNPEENVKLSDESPPPKSQPPSTSTRSAEPVPVECQGGGDQVVTASSEKVAAPTDFEEESVQPRPSPPDHKARTNFLLQKITQASEDEGGPKGTDENPPSEFFTDLKEIEDSKQLNSPVSNGSLNHEDLNSHEKLAESEISMDEKDYSDDDMELVESELSEDEGEGALGASSPKKSYSLSQNSSNFQIESPTSYQMNCRQIPLQNLNFGPDGQLMNRMMCINMGGGGGMQNNLQINLTQSNPHQSVQQHGVGLQQHFAPQQSFQQQPHRPVYQYPQMLSPTGQMSMIMGYPGQIQSYPQQIPIPQYTPLPYGAHFQYPPFSNVGHLQPGLPVYGSGAQPLNYPQYEPTNDEIVKNISKEFFFTQNFDATIEEIQKKFPGEQVGVFIELFSRKIAENSKADQQKLGGSLVKTMLAKGLVSKERVMDSIMKGVISNLHNIQLDAPMAIPYLAVFLVEIFPEVKEDQVLKYLGKHQSIITKLMASVEENLGKELP